MDYMGIPSDLVFNSGGGTMQCLYITIIDDTIAEFCEETLTYSFSTTSSRVTLPSAQDLVIMDNDNGNKISTTASFEAYCYSIYFLSDIDTCVVDDTPDISDVENRFRIAVTFTGCVASAVCITQRNANSRTFDCKCPPVASLYV